MTASRLIYGYRIESEATFARLRLGATDRGTIAVRRTERALLEQSGQIVQVVEDPSRDSVAFLVARVGSRLVAWCAYSGAYEIDAAAGLILSDRDEGEAWEDRLLTGVLPMLLLDRGELLLHACAVRTEQGALVIAGPSGRGKSTLAAVLDSLGLSMLAEDCAALTLHPGGPRLWPGVAGVRLHAEAAAALRHFSPALTNLRGKEVHLPPHPPPGDPLPVAGLVLLDPRGGQGLEVQRLEGPQALASLFPSVYRLEIERSPEAFARAGELVRAGRCFRASFPEDVDRLPRLALDLVEQTSAALDAAAAA